MASSPPPPSPPPRENNELSPPSISHLEERERWKQKKFSKGLHDKKALAPQTTEQDETPQTQADKTNTAHTTTMSKDEKRDVKRPPKSQHFEAKPSSLLQSSAKRKFLRSAHNSNRQQHQHIPLATSKHLSKKQVARKGGGDNVMLIAAPPPTFQEGTAADTSSSNHQRLQSNDPKKEEPKPIFYSTVTARLVASSPPPVVTGVVDIYDENKNVNNNKIGDDEFDDKNGTSTIPVATPLQAAKSPRNIRKWVVMLLLLLVVVAAIIVGVVLGVTQTPSHSIGTEMTMQPTAPPIPSPSPSVLLSNAPTPTTLFANSTFAPSVVIGVDSNYSFAPSVSTNSGAQPHA